MDPIAWGMRYGLPNQTYYEFVGRYLLTDQAAVDPFTVDVPDHKAEAIYVARTTVEDELNKPGTQFILGSERSGKTTQFKKLLGLSHGPTLTVRLSLPHIMTWGSEEELMDGKISPLAIATVAYHTFNAYWNDLLRNSFNRGRFLPQLRRDKQWMARLRWFYHRFPPQYPEIPGEFELMAWLRASPNELFSSQIASESLLQELIDFITSIPPSQGRLDISPPERPYSQIRVLIDGTECLSNLAIARLLQDAQRLFDLYRDNIPFKLFADSALKAQLEDLDCVRQGRIALYCLPQWQSDELQEMLHRRLQAWGQGEFAEYNWGKLIPDTHLSPHAQSKLVTTIVNGALQVYQSDDPLDAPIHLLRIGRGLMAACAGCWQNEGYSPPLNQQQIEELITRYWDHHEERGGV